MGSHELQMCSSRRRTATTTYRGRVPSSPTSPSPVHAPFHGMVTVLVAEGDEVDAGQVVAVLEAMKMEAPITAPRGGTVREVARLEPGTPVPGGELILLVD